MDLVRLGWAAPFNTAFAAFQDETLIPARVGLAQREHFKLWTERGPIDASLSGRLRHEADSGGLPVVGDWVATRLDPGGERGVITALLPRRGALVRKRPDGDPRPQLLAANLDTVFIVSSLNHDFSPRRIERALAMIWESGAQPVVLLTKLDDCDDPEPLIDEAQSVALGAPVHAVSAWTGVGLDALEPYLTCGRSIALIGSSGVGKSTLVNWCCGELKAATSAVREGDDKGRHTTTTRELYLLPSGALLIDTPGMRELALWDAETGLDTTFEDIEALAAECRFSDCLHQREPGCAIRAALQSGALDPSRYAARDKLRREQAHQQRQHDPKAAFEHHQKIKAIFRQRAKDQRSHPKR